MRAFLFFVILLFSTISAWSQTQPKNHLIYLGGGGEAPGRYTIFDSSTRKFGSYFGDNPNWSTDLSFDGGHGYVEEIIKDKFKNATNPSFTENSFKKTIADAQNQIQNKLSPGEQILIVIDSHGATATQNQTTHSVCAVEESWDQCQVLSLDPLVELAKSAKTKGVKLAIVDLSCHSGFTQSIADQTPETCIISATSETSFAIKSTIGGFANDFAGKIEKGKNLESLYLEARQNDQQADLPQISTHAGKMIQEKIMPMMSERLLFDNKDMHTKLLSEILSKRKNEKTLGAACDQNTIQQMMNWSQTVLNQSQKKDFDAKYSNLQNAIKKYDETRSKIETQLLTENDLNQYIEPISCLREWSQGNTSVKEKVEYKSIQYTASELMTTDFESRVKSYSKKDTSTDDMYNRMSDSCQIEIANKAINARNKLKKDPHYLENLDRESQLTNLYDKTYELSRDVGEKERDLYQDLYKALDDKTKPNPCRDFVL